MIVSLSSWERERVRAYAFLTEALIRPTGTFSQEEKEEPKAQVGRFSGPLNKEPPSNGLMGVPLEVER
jgi:hypothetical protein